MYSFRLSGLTKKGKDTHDGGLIACYHESTTLRIEEDIYDISKRKYLDVWCFEVYGSLFPSGAEKCFPLPRLHEVWISILACRSQECIYLTIIYSSLSSSQEAYMPFDSYVVEEL